MDALEPAYAALAGQVAGLDRAASWGSTGCVGWAVRDLVFHLRADCLRALVALHNPTERGTDCDEVSYWREWGSDAEADDLNRRHTRMEAGHYPWPTLRTMYAEANAAARRAAALVDPRTVVQSQGYALTAEHLVSTLVVEATLHHLDLVAHLPGDGGPSPEGLAETRRVCEALLGRSLPGWSDLRIGLVATGRAEPTDHERVELGDARVPAFT